MFITGLGTAAPSQRYTQRECWNVFERSPLSRQLNPRSRAIVRTVLTGKNGIDSRHLALTSLAEAFDLSPDALHARFRNNSISLASQAAKHALADSGVRPNEI